MSNETIKLVAMAVVVLFVSGFGMAYSTKLDGDVKKKSVSVFSMLFGILAVAYIILKIFT